MVILMVRVIPRASKPGIAVEPDGSLKVRLTSPPVEGAANAELVEMLARAFALPRRAVTIAGGAHARTKRVQLDGISAAQVNQALALTASSSASRPPRHPAHRRPRR
jgi:uncharacterized protein (TIGR00251 family)